MHTQEETLETKSIEELELEYEDEKNSMIAITETGINMQFLNCIPTLQLVDMLCIFNY